MAGPTQWSVTDAPCCCGYLHHAAEDESRPIVFDPVMNEYHFEYPCPNGQGKATMMIYHCPMCGGAAPHSRRASMFAVVQDEESQRLYKMFQDIYTLEDAIRVLGPPDLDLPGGVCIQQQEGEGTAPTSESFRMLTYTRLSDTVDVRITDYHKDRVHFTLQGKYIGPPDAGDE